MSTRTHARTVLRINKLDSKPYLDSAARMRRLVDKALGRYGEPTLSLEQLRATLDRQLGKISLSQLVLQEREEGW